MRTLRVSAAALLFAVPALMSAAQEGGTTDAMEASLAAGWKATFICSGIFVAGQTLPEIERNELSGIYPDYQRQYDQLPEAEIDQARQLVSVTYAPEMPPRFAAYRPGFGCTQLPAGAGEAALGFLPLQAGVSFEGHLFGAIAGVFAARTLARPTAIDARPAERTDMLKFWPDQKS